MIERTIAPPTGSIDAVEFVKAEKVVLENSMPVYMLHAGADEVTRLEVVYPAGTFHQNRLCVAAATNALIQEGTLNYSASTLADQFDFYGAFLQNSCAVQEASYALFTLNKYFEPCIRLFAEMLRTATFPDAETDIYRNAQKQRLQISLQKNSVLARQLFFQTLFGKEHVLGRFASPEDYDALTSEHLRTFYHDTYLSNLPSIFLSGNISSAQLDLVKKTFGKQTGVLPHGIPPMAEPVQKEGGYIFREKTGSLQAAIRMGKITITRNHPDYLGLQLTNLIFGGYFGSRLMKNIREDKGLTYGIYSSVEPYKGVGVFTIATEVNNKDHRLAVAEIHHELDRMCEEFVPEAELEKAKSYLLGSFVRNFDGPFAQMDRFRSLHDFDMDYRYYTDYVQNVKKISALDIKNLSVKYLDKNSFTTIVVGTNN